MKTIRCRLEWGVIYSGMKGADIAFEGISWLVLCLCCLVGFLLFEEKKDFIVLKVCLFKRLLQKIRA